MFHGGCLDAAARYFPDAPRPWLDLSTGINPDAWEAPSASTIDLRALPSAQALARLEATAGTAFGARHLPVAALPGTELGLRLLGRLGLPRPYRHVAPGYRTHAAALPGSTAISPDRIDEVGGGTLLLANPNNPDGRLVPPDRLLDLARRLGRAGGVLLIDEAFADAAPEASVLPRLAPEDRVLVFRSFGKFFGLAGLRLGFVSGAADLIGEMREQLGSWPVSAPAIALGTAAYADTDWILGTRRRLAARCEELDETLRRHRLYPKGSCPLFRLIETPAAPVIFEHLAQRGILTRPFDYAPDWLRIGLPANAEAVTRLDRALTDR
ncbi:pyridoxal phosphate-dependent class II aminotransferase [Sphingomonas desiccabilis]|uniref:Aminotransferase n=1 Tax=Sphingomonas desiccabilis TaxID=429134 RepID=A0A4Q2IYU3_9SPHN|nr:aminotransferase class I/II-fold pyridoxal phosphate-dependent enzyme [Sphingomonas desiccabilis]RXZ35696.1 pyridoxal phosphate-dependent class II aminotransferase [Sphingomonas desiccabilis]